VAGVLPLAQLQKDGVGRLRSNLTLVKFQSSCLSTDPASSRGLVCTKHTWGRALTNLEQLKEILKKVEEKAEENPSWEETLQQIMKHICSQKSSTFSAKQSHRAGEAPDDHSEMLIPLSTKSQDISLKPMCVHVLSSFLAHTPLH
jgi:hypothetical protein